MHLSLFGGFECRAADGAALRFPTRKVRALFAYLLVSATQSHARSKLAALLWGDHAEAEARANLRKALSRLRGCLPDEARHCLAVAFSHVAVRPDGLEVDVLRFERLVADGTPETLEGAVGLYRGPLLQDLDDCGEEFDDWLGTERRRLDEMLQQALQRLLEHYVVTGAIDRAIQVAFRLLARDPMQESVHRSLIRLYMYQDRVGSALDQYRRCRELLARELGSNRRRRPRGSGPSCCSSSRRAAGDQGLPGGAGRRARARPGDRGRRRGACAPARRAGGAPVDRRAVVRREAASWIAISATAWRRTSRPSSAASASSTCIAPTTALAFRDAAVAPERAGGSWAPPMSSRAASGRSGSGCALTVRLVESATGRQLWAERYDCRGAEIFALQDDVVRRIVGSSSGRSRTRVWMRPSAGGRTISRPTICGCAGGAL